MNGLALLALAVMAAVTWWACTATGRAWLDHQPTRDGDDT